MKKATEAETVRDKTEAKASELAAARDAAEARADEAEAARDAAVSVMQSMVKRIENAAENIKKAG